jgi:hypothetical protein
MGLAAEQPDGAPVLPQPSSKKDIYVKLLPAWAVCCIAVVIAGTAGCSGARPDPGSEPGGTLASSRGGAASASSLSGLTADQIFAKAAARFRGISSVHLGGTIEVTPPAIGLDLTLTPGGCAGTLEIANAATLAIVVTGGYQYLRGAARTWEKTAIPSRDVALVAGRWLKTSDVGGGYGGTATVCHDSSEFARWDPDSSRWVQPHTSQALKWLPGEAAVACPQCGAADH